jgi:opacity protein-like surface antigen
MVASVAAAAQSAQAADLPDLSDMPVLRGGITDGLSRSSVNWQGAYIGGQVGYSSANMDFSNATQSLTAYMLQNLSYQGEVSGFTLLGKTSPSGIGFGGFVGYNAQWDDAVLGIEANYNHFSNLTGSQVNNQLPAVNVPGGCLAVPSGDSDLCGVQLSGSASARLTDELTLRGRAGWAVGNFMPYMFGGLALGLADITRTATLVQTDFISGPVPVNPNPVLAGYNATTPNNNVFTYGYTAGFGLEAMLWGGLFARGEYEYVKFATVKNINIQMSTVRGGLGYKF